MLDGFCSTTRLLPILAMLAWRQRFSRQMWGIEPRRYIHHDVVEGDVWHTPPQMRDLRYWQTYCMMFLSFERASARVDTFLTTCYCYICEASIPIQKQMKLVLYRLAYGVSCARMYNLYGCGESKIRKCTLYICCVLTSREGIFHHFFHTPIEDRLQGIVKKFRDITGLPNIAGTIDGTHILLTCRPTRRFTLMPLDFYNRKRFHIIVLQGVCDAYTRIYWNVCVGQPSGVHDASQFTVSSLHTAKYKANSS